MLLAGLDLPAWAQGQGFMVKPIRVEAMAGPSQEIEVPLQVRNIAGTGSVVVNLRVVELMQGLDGGWQLIETESTSALPYSSRQWTSLSANQVSVAPMEPAEVSIRVQPPASARGVYFAGIIAETPAPENPTGISVRVRFLVPVIVYILGRPVPQVVGLDDVLMEYVTEPGTMPTTMARLRVANRGGTYSRIRGNLRIEREHEGRWRSVTTLDVPERGILPGATIEVGNDLRRRLPSGTYRLRGELYVDGRRASVLDKELAFDGDPEADAVAYDTALVLSPPVLDLNVTPGATRTTIVRVENPGDEPIDVSMLAAIPRVLLGVEMNGTLGTELAAADWTEIRPAEFTIAPGRWQNVRVVTRLPRDGLVHPHYYADLILSGKYANGESAGDTRSTIHLANSHGATAPSGAIELTQLAETENPGVYAVQVRFANTGNAAMQPLARTLLLSAQGRAMRNILLVGDDGSLLPFGKRTFSGDLNFNDLSPGYYVLRSTVTLAPQVDVGSEQIVHVELSDGLLSVSQVGPEDLEDLDVLPMQPADRDSEHVQ